MLSEHGGCIDVDECTAGNNECGKNEFCVNKEGSYECLSMNIILLMLIFNSTKITRFMVPICLSSIYSSKLSFFVV